MIYIPWVAIAVVWFAGALRGKVTTRREDPGERLLHIVGTVLAFWLLFSVREAAKSNIREEIGFVLCVAGIAFAIWARLLLGTNWSGLITLKENHELIRRGPYAIVRHPIYSGALLAMLGTAIHFGRAQCFVGVALAFAAWWRKSRIEERFLIDFFGDQYRRYRRDVRALIPGLL